MNALALIALIAFCFALGGAIGSFATYSKLRAKIEAQLLLEDRQRRNLEHVESIREKQVWWHPRVGRCVIHAVYENLGQISVWVPDKKNSNRFYSAREIVTLDLKPFRQKATFLALWDGDPNELPSPADLEAKRLEEEAEAMRMLEAELRGELPRPIVSEEAPEDTTESRWQWALKRLSQSAPEAPPREKLKLPFL